MTATRVRKVRYRRKPGLIPCWSGTERQPTALAIAAVGKLPEIADRMGRGEATVYKWAQAERGPEHDLAGLFPALAAAGIPLELAMLIPKRVRSMCLEAYSSDLPDFDALQDEETRLDGEEDVYQRAVNRAGPIEKASTQSLIDAKTAWELSSATYDVLAAIADRELKARGVM